MSTPPQPVACIGQYELPKIEVALLEESQEHLTDCEDVELSFVSAKSVSTYPYSAETKKRDGDPIADRMYCSITKNRTIVAIADGCNWGVRPQQAAINATAAFKNYLKDRHKQIKNLQDAGHFLYRAFSEAHHKIIEGKEDIWEAGTTTLLGGICLELKAERKGDPKWGFVCASVGDCKAYLLSSETKKVTDITKGNRLHQKDPRDPGGRLGPYLGHGDPDLRNLQLYFVPCNKGDIIIIVSDGVHDNLDPETIGKSPKDLKLDAENWEDLEKSTVEEAKTKFRNHLIENLIVNKKINPLSVTDTLVSHCIEVTRRAREYMEQNPTSNQPKDYVNYPGKMDHTTCISFKVGKIKELSLPQQDEDDMDQEYGDDGKSLKKGHKKEGKKEDNNSNNHKSSKEEIEETSSPKHSRKHHKHKSDQIKKEGERRREKSPKDKEEEEFLDKKKDQEPVFDISNLEEKKGTRRKDKEQKGKSEEGSDSDNKSPEHMRKSHRKKMDIS